MCLGFWACPKWPKCPSFICYPFVQHRGIFVILHFSAVLPNTGPPISPSVLLGLCWRHYWAFQGPLPSWHALRGISPVIVYWIFNLFFTVYTHIRTPAPSVGYTGLRCSGITMSHISHLTEVIGTHSVPFQIPINFPIGYPEASHSRLDFLICE